MMYFSQENHYALLSVQSHTLSGDTGVQSAHRRLLDLHNTIYPRMRKYGMDLHTDALPKDLIALESVASPFEMETLALTYTRSYNQATAVERMMGREDKVEAHRHPVIEMRLTPYAFTIELIVSPDAWYDQQNFAGKLTLEQYRSEFVKLLTKMSSEYCFGFWKGTQLSDMHLNTGQLPPARVTSEWISTFAAGRDFLRIGRWYEPGDPALDETTINAEVFRCMRDLSTIYEFIAWTGNNDFRSFYLKNLAARA